MSLRSVFLQDAQLRLAAIVGLGYAYAGSCREDSKFQVGGVEGLGFGVSPE